MTLDYKVPTDGHGRFGRGAWEDSDSARLRRLSREYRMTDGDTRNLEGLLTDRFSIGPISLEPIGKCVWPVFKARVSGKVWAFVKVAPCANNQRTIDFSRFVSDCDLVPKVLHDKPIEFGFRSVLCTEWRECKRVGAEEMSDSEALSFLDGIVRLSSAMRNAPDVLESDGRDSPLRQLEIVMEWARRHPYASRFFSSLKSLAPEACTYGKRPLTTIHGDMHMKNYGFNDGRFSTVFDFDTLVKGLPCEDASYAFTERMRKSGMSASFKHRLLDLFRLVVSKSPWPTDEWRIAVNHARLRIASRRLLKHPNNPWVAIDVARRDRELVPLLKVLG